MDVAEEEPSRPLSVAEITEQALKYQWNPAIPFKYWVRAADILYQEGAHHYRDGNYAQAYLFLYRHSHLISEHVSKLPEAKDREEKKALRPQIKRLPLVLQQLEDLRPRLDESHKEWLKIKASEKDLVPPTGGTLSPHARQAQRDSLLSWSPAARAKVLDAGEHQDLAVDLAQKEIQRRDAARRATRQAGISEEEEQQRRGAGLWDDWQPAGDDPGPQLDQDQSFRNRMEAARRRLDHPGDNDASRSSLRYPSQDVARPSSSTAYHYPSISQSRALEYTASPNKLRKTSPHQIPPRPPPKVSGVISPLRPYSPPPSAPPPSVPQKEPIYASEQPGLPHSPAPSVPPKTLEAPPKKYTFRPAAYLEDGTPIRPIFLPERLRDEFLNVAADNTRKGLELCGMLCGTQVNNALFISCLLIPDQKCTADTCETENEAAMMEYCIEHDLIVIGWIHTHPTQTCFMSSRDLHTHAGYQVMLPESIAIVCAPRFEPSYGIFRLTSPPGLQHILNCRHNDTFHQHSIDNIYTESGHPPGHVYVSSRLEFYVHDLRPKR